MAIYLSQCSDNRYKIMTMHIYIYESDTLLVEPRKMLLRYTMHVDGLIAGVTIMKSSKLLVWATYT